MPDPRIRYHTGRDIDRKAWDACIEGAPNGLIYATSLYLDRMTEHWDGLVLGDYQAVMPLPWRKKGGIHYLYQPAFVAQLGLFGKNIDADLLKAFLDSIPPTFRYWDLTLNTQNLLPLEDYPMSPRANYVLSLRPSYEEIRGRYRENIRRNIKKAAGYGCRVKKDIPLDAIIGLAREQEQQGQTTASDYRRFSALYEDLKALSKAESYGIYGKEDQLLASCVFFFSPHRVYYILVGNHPNGRTLGASHALIDAFIRDHAGRELLLDFEGSDLRNLAFFYSSFGAVEERYPAIRRNRLPWYIRWLKPGA
ncbi:MAG: GNAT family N-acetyltransferase [Flavisolibacter sp.]